MKKWPFTNMLSSIPKISNYFPLDYHSAGADPGGGGGGGAHPAPPLKLEKI